MRRPLIFPDVSKNASRCRNACMSARPKATGSSPRSARIRSDSDRRTRQPTWWRTDSPALVRRPGRTRRLGRSSAAHRLAASRSQCWLIRVNDTVPLWPNTTRSHSSLPTSVSGVDRARPACAANPLARPLNSRSRPSATTYSLSEPTCWRRRSSQNARSVASLVLTVLIRQRCCSPNSTWATSSGGSPRMLTCPPRPIAGSVARQCRSSRSGSRAFSARSRC